MKAYLATTGSVFGLLVIVHIWRMAVEPSVLHEPFVIGVTIIAAALCVWAWRLFATAARAG